MEFIPSPRKRWHRCERKKALSETAAKALAEKIRQRCKTPRDAFMIAYQCYYGDHWHIGHVSPDSRIYKEVKMKQE